MQAIEADRISQLEIKGQGCETVSSAALFVEPLSTRIRIAVRSEASPMRVQKILETCVYAPDLEAAEAFYAGVLGMELHSKQAGRHLFFRVGDGMFLVFDPKGTMPDHGTTGRGHAAFVMQESEIDAWRNYFKEKGVATREIVWPEGGHSIYFNDPANNSIELATTRTWYEK